MQFSQRRLPHFYLSSVSSGIELELVQCSIPACGLIGGRSLIFSGTNRKVVALAANAPPTYGPAYAATGAP